MATILYKRKAALKSDDPQFRELFPNRVGFFQECKDGIALVTVPGKSNVSCWVDFTSILSNSHSDKKAENKSEKMFRLGRLEDEVNQKVFDIEPPLIRLYAI